MKWLIGIDGGGTKTVAYAAGLTGGILGRLEKGPGNYHVTGLTAFKNLITAIVAGLAAKCGQAPADLALISMGLAGADRKRDQEIILAALGDLALNCPCIICSDAKIALAAGVGRAEGIMLIAGTGSVAYGINDRQEVIRAGGWGHVASDEGSGYAIGREALARAIKAREGRDKDTRLMSLIIEYFGLRDWDELIGFINSPAATKARIASLARLTADAARNGDAVAAEILAEAAAALAGLVESVLTRGFAGKEPVPVCIYGGILQHIAAVRTALAEKLRGKAELVALQREPAVGALELGRNWLRDPNLDKGAM